MSIPVVDPIRDRRTFKCKPHLNYPGTTNQGTAYNSRTPTIAKLHVSIVYNHIRLMSLPSTSEISILIHKVKIGKAWC